MNLGKDEIELAINAGLELLGPESEVVVPVKLNDGVFLLKQLLMSIAAGRIGLTPTTQTDPAVPANRKQRRVAKKVAKKAASKKTSRKK